MALAFTVCNINHNIPHFSAQKPKKEAEKKYDNPIIPGFEYLDATKATALGALGLAVRLFAELDLGDLFEDVNNATIKGKKIAEKNQGMKLIAAGFMAVSALFFLAKLPKALYSKKKEIFVKKNEWDVYSRNNSAEQAIYQRMAQEAQAASTERKQELAKDFLKMRMLRNRNFA